MATYACDGKVRYETRKAAKRAWPRQWPYRCQVCGGWHNTSKKPYRPTVRKLYGELPPLEDDDGRS